MSTKKNKKTSSEKAKGQDRVQNDSELYEKKFKQSVGIENYNKTDEPVVTPSEEAKKKPSVREEQQKEKS